MRPTARRHREEGPHDQRRALLLNFLREAFGIESTEVELERKIKAAEVRGRIDAFWRHLIIEVKTDLDRERDDARVELKKYFEAQRHPLDYLGLVTDGLRFEVYLYESQQAGVRLVSGFILEADQPLHAFRHLDQVFFTGQRLAPTSGDIVIRLGQHSAVFNASLRRLGALYDAVADDTTVQTKFREWNALLAKVYGSALGDRTPFLKHTYLVMISRAIVAAALAPAQVPTGPFSFVVRRWTTWRQSALAFAPLRQGQGLQRAHQGTHLPLWIARQDRGEAVHADGHLHALLRSLCEGVPQARRHHRLRSA